MGTIAVLPKLAALEGVDRSTVMRMLIDIGLLARRQAAVTMLAALMKGELDATYAALD